MNDSHKTILNPVFLLCLFILILNDLVLKAAFPGFITGKLSDLAGMIVFAGFFQALFNDRWKLHVYLLTAVSFAFWKSEFSQGMIDLWNSHVGWIHFERTVDYTDILCTVILVPFYFYKPRSLQLRFRKELVIYPLLGISLMAIVATSRMRSFHSYRSEHLYLEVLKKVEVPLPQEMFFKNLQEGAFGEQDTIPSGKNFYYTVRGLKLENDTISYLYLHVKSRRQKVRVEIVSMGVQNYWKTHVETEAASMEAKEVYREKIIRYFENLGN